jgi:ribose transport system permease protein
MKYSPQQFLAELLAKKWMEPVFPFSIMVVLILASGSLIDGYFALQSIASRGRDFADFGFVVLAMAIVVISGGIDLSVGAIFAAANILVLLLISLFQWPVPLACLAVCAVGALLGAVNGFLIGYVKTRPFMTTLVSLIIIRAIVALLDGEFSVRLAGSMMEESALWKLLGGGTIFGVPTNVALLIILSILGHIFLSRSRLGWRIIATGGDRRAALHAGIDIRLILLKTYILSGILASLGGVLYAARLDSASSNSGALYEILALTAVVLGGVSLGGGRGSVGKALIGATVILVLKNSMVIKGVPGSAQDVIFGAIALLAVGADVRWGKNRFKALETLFMVPGAINLPKREKLSRTSTDAFRVNNRLNDALPVAQPEVLGPGDVLFDRQARLYTGQVDGWIMRYADIGSYKKREFWCRTGGWPLGMQFDQEENLIVCIAGRGLFGVRPNSELFELTSETRKRTFSLRDDSRIRAPYDLDIAPDGKIYFSNITYKYDIHGWMTDALEGRGNGSLICYDPATKTTRTIQRDIPGCTGVVLSHDGECLYVGSGWNCRIMRYWLAGPKKGKFETFIENLPGYPGMINRGSDGTYWLCFFGIRSPSYDVAMRMPAFRRRMARRVPPDDWMLPNFHTGLVAKFNDQGEVLESMWDPLGRTFPMINSIREERGYLYFGGLNAMIIGQKNLEGVDPTWNGVESYWGNPSGRAVYSRNTSIATQTESMAAQGQALRRNREEMKG